MTETNTLVDIQDPLPESNWLWRRVFSFLLVAALMGFLWKTIDNLAATALLNPDIGIGALLKVCRYLCLFAFMVVTYYLIAPSAEQVVKMFKTAALLRSGVQIAQRSVESPSGRKETASTVGQPPQPEPPAIPGPAPDTINEEAPAPEPEGKKQTEILE